MPWSVSVVPVDQVDHVWLALEPQILKAHRQGAGDRTTPAEAYAALKLGKMSMWAIHRESEVAGCLMLNVYQYPTKKCLFLEVIAGRNMDEWIDTLEKLVFDYKDLIGADMVETSCRPGLARFLERRSWRRKAVLMEV